MCVVNGIAYHNAVFIGLEYYLLAEQYTSDPIDGGGHFVTVVFANVFVPVRAAHTSLVKVQPKVELCAVFHYRGVER